MSRSPLKKWEKGVPLKDAYIDYFGFPNHENSEEAKQTRFNYFVLGQDAEAGEYDAYDPETYRYSPKAKQHRLKVQNDFRNTLCISFANHLSAGDLVAVGIRSNFEGDKEYAEIPRAQIEVPRINNSDELTAADIYSGGIRKICEPWDEDIFYGLTQKYEDVRIYDPRYNLDGTPNKKYFPKKVAETEKQYSDRSGKPSKREGVFEIYQNLKSRNKIDFYGTQLKAARLIQEYIKTEMSELWGNGEYLDEKTIANHIRDDFNAEKAKARAGKKNS